MSAQKLNAARAALDYVEDGMILGLGSGSTAAEFVRLLGAALKQDEIAIKGIPTSRETEQIAREAGVPLIPIEQADRIDLTVDGADEVDGRFRLIKGGGACLLREKIIADASDLMVVIIDETKLVESLGAFPLPVEVDPFGFTITAKKVFDALRRAGVARPEVTLRRLGDGLEPLVTDGGHYILDCACGEIPEPELAAAELIDIPGVIEHGLFLDLARVVIVGEDDGARVMEL
ncbi:ribose-5-phosphate isomerase RpiA [Marinicauda algicola]|uniref:Ribose-5-phosphate isomerase A n=1 Tax=Marinicauda algicola TaxID=2029849 RepID=A0A4S2H259_9PROT|nr:ribose-5-phosphate isomerase RpiA [Marinicauda algicola]TGY89606.1 ribose-5-phosphate isomerase RpiA [Marinicauda algicola]